MNRRQRLRGRKRFVTVRRDGTTARQGDIRVAVLRNDVGAPRVGIAVRDARCAVQRNRARRRLRAALRGALHQEHNGIDVVVMAPAGLANRPFADVASAVAAALTDAVTLVMR